MRKAEWNTFGINIKIAVPLFKVLFLMLKESSVEDFLGSCRSTSGSKRARHPEFLGRS